MKNFFDLIPNRIISVDEYLFSINCEIKREKLEWAFKAVDDVFSIIKIKYHSECSIPKLRIAYESFNAEGMDGMIEIGEKLIEHCLNLKFCNIKEVFDKNFYFDDDIIFISSLTWIAAHEYFHIIRFHNKLLEKEGLEYEVLHAIEHDADLCAVAEIFRVNQKYFFGILNLIEIKKITFYMVFWLIRTFPHHIGNPMTHQEPILRLYGICGKLAILSESHIYEVDVNMSKDETKESFESIILFYFLCEKKFKEIYTSEEYGDLNIVLDKIVNKDYGRHITKKWDQIREAVGINSKTKT